MTMVKDPENEKALTIKPGEGFFHRITIEKLNDLGYELTGRQKLMGGRPYRYVLLAIRHEGDKNEVGFCYLYSYEEETGVVLPKTFNEYLSLLASS